MCKIEEVLSQNIRKHLDRKGMTAEKLAFEAEVSKSLLSEVLNKKKYASLKTIEKLAMALGLTYAELFFHIYHENCILHQEFNDDRV